MTDHLIFRKQEEYAPGDILISSHLIDKRIDELADEIAKDYRGSKLLIIGLLTGAVWFTVDLFTRIYKLGINDCYLTFMKIQSYPDGSDSSNDPRIEYDTSFNPKGRHVLIVDDIADTGKSLSLVQKILHKKEISSLKSIVLLDKPSRREVTFTPNYIGFTIPNIWVQGRGLDTDGLGRGDPNIKKALIFPNVPFERGHLIRNHCIKCNRI